MQHGVSLSHRKVDSSLLYVIEDN